MGTRKQGQNAGFRHARQGRVFAPVFPQVNYEGRDIHYAISFHPRICAENAYDCDDPVEVVMHELWHISTKCDGKLRRMRHGKEFNRIVKDLTETYYRNGGEGIERCQKEDRVRVRYWKNRQSPSIAYIRRGLMEQVAREMAKIRWQEYWSEEHIAEKNMRMSSCIPRVHQYICPNGHTSTSKIRYRASRSCSICSPKFSERYLLKKV